MFRGALRHELISQNQHGIAGEDGSILPYDRETVRVGDGVETPANTVAEVRVTSPRLVLLTVRVKNTAAEPREI